MGNLEDEKTQPEIQSKDLVSIHERPKKQKSVVLKEGDMVGKHKIIDVIEPETGMNNIYVVQHTETQHVNALKIEPRDSPTTVLRTELFILLQIRKKDETNQFCTVFDKGQTSTFNWIVITLAGASLNILRREMPEKKFSLGCGLSVAKQCLRAIQQLHKIGFVHRDICPSNFAAGRREFEEERKIYFLDFGFSRQYMEDNQLKRPRANPPKYAGSLRHAPRNAYLERELSRADDLESWFYMVVELIKGGLPWMNMKNPEDVFNYQRKARNMGGLERKELLGGLPKEFEQIMLSVDKLTFYDEPAYHTLFVLIDAAIKNNNVQEFPYDWEEKPGAAPAAAPTPQ